jgi:hypothetical protein
MELCLGCSRNFPRNLCVVSERLRAGLAMNNSGVFRERLEDEGESLKSNPISYEHFLMKNRKNIFGFFVATD